MNNTHGQFHQNQLTSNSNADYEIQQLNQQFTNMQVANAPTPQSSYLAALQKGNNTPTVGGAQSGPIDSASPVLELESEFAQNKSDQVPSGPDSQISDTASSLSREEEYPAELHDIALLRKICVQVEHYLSDEYLSTDKYLLRQLRSKSEGYLSVKLLTSFKKIKKLTRNWRVTSAALKLSNKLILSQDGCRVRRLDDLPENLRRCRTMTSVLCIRVPDNWANLETISELFSPFGNITLARILKPGKPIPTDLRNYATQIPDMGRTCCAVVEFSNCDSAHQSCRILRDRNLHGMRIALLGPRIRRTLYKPEKKKPGNAVGCQPGAFGGFTAQQQAFAVQQQLCGNQQNHFIRQLLQNPQGWMSAAAAVLAQQQQNQHQQQQQHHHAHHHHQQQQQQAAQAAAAVSANFGQQHQHFFDQNAIHSSQMQQQGGNGVGGQVQQQSLFFAEQAHYNFEQQKTNDSPAQERQQARMSSSHEGSSSESGVIVQKNAAFLGALQSVVDNIIQSDPEESTAAVSAKVTRTENHTNINDNWGNVFAPGADNQHNQQVGTTSLASIFDNNSNSIWNSTPVNTKEETGRNTPNTTVMKSLWSTDAGNNNTASIW